MPNDDEGWFTQREQAHAAVLFVVLFVVSWIVVALLSMPIPLAVGVLSVPVPAAVGAAAWERRRRRSS